MPLRSGPATAGRGRDRDDDAAFADGSRPAASARAASGGGCTRGGRRASRTRSVVSVAPVRWVGMSVTSGAGGGRAALRSRRRPAIAGRPLTMTSLIPIGYRAGSVVGRGVGHGRRVEHDEVRERTLAHDAAIAQAEASGRHGRQLRDRASPARGSRDRGRTCRARAGRAAVGSRVRARRHRGPDGPGAGPRRRCRPRSRARP